MIQLKGVEKVYLRGSEEVHALRGVDLDISPGEFLAVVGPSGAGKTTLLHMLGCLDHPSSGSVTFHGSRVDDLPDSRLTEFRRRKIGFVFQEFYLIPGLTVAENISLPLLFARSREKEEHVRALIETVGLGKRASHLPKQLSGGEMQRVAIARALVNSPEIVLADEPTGNLDTENSEKIFGLLRSLSTKGLTIIMITHNNDLALRADRIISLRDGKIRS